MLLDVNFTRSSATFSTEDATLGIILELDNIEQPVWYDSGCNESGTFHMNREYVDKTDLEDSSGYACYFN